MVEFVERTSAETLDKASPLASAEDCSFTDITLRLVDCVDVDVFISMAVSIVSPVCLTTQLFNTPLPRRRIVKICSLFGELESLGYNQVLIA